MSAPNPADIDEESTPRKALLLVEPRELQRIIAETITRQIDTAPLIGGVSDLFTLPELIAGAPDLATIPDHAAGNIVQILLGFEVDAAESRRYEQLVIRLSGVLEMLNDEIRRSLETQRALHAEVVALRACVAELDGNGVHLKGPTS